MSIIEIDGGPSRRTLQRRARAAGQARFAWDPDKDRVLEQFWLMLPVASLCARLGCKPRALYLRAGALGLPPRDPVARAVRSGTAQRAPMALPTYDELRRSIVGPSSSFAWVRS